MRWGGQGECLKIHRGGTDLVVVEHVKVRPPDADEAPPAALLLDGELHEGLDRLGALVVGGSDGGAAERAKRADDVVLGVLHGGIDGRRQRLVM